MAGPVLYSANPWFAGEVAERYRGSRYAVWASEYIDSAQAPPGSAGVLIAPSSTPLRIYQRLDEACENEDEHCDLIRNYRKTFSRLAKAWLADHSINQDQYDEIIVSVRSTSWKIWRPRLYVIPRQPIEAAGRVKFVPRTDRAAYGSEFQILDLQPHEFDIIKLTL
jgi:hypothetical protein